MRTRSFLGRALFVLLPLATVWMAWVMHPPADNPPALEEMLGKAWHRRQDLYLRARDPQLNGALHSRFLSWWRAKGSAPALDAAIQSWIHYSSQSERQYLDHRPLLEDSRYLKARKDFEALVPELEEAWQKPVFCATSPALKDDLRLLVLNRVALCFLALAEDQLARQQPERALHSIFPVLSLGNHYLERELAIDHLLGLALLNHGTDTLLYALDAGEVPPKGWEFLRKHLPKVIPLQTAVARTLAGELLFMQEQYDEPPIGAVAWRDRVIQFLPGTERRERRMLENFLLRSYQAALSTEIPQIQQGPLMLSEWLIGKTGYYQSEFSFNITETARLTSRHRRIMAAAYLFACLKEYQLKHKEYPENLAALPAPPGIRWDPDFQYTPGQLLSINLPVTTHLRPSVYPAGKRVRISSSNLVFDLGQGN